MFENYLLTDFAPRTPMRCAILRFTHERQQMHDYFEISMIVSGNCNLDLEGHLYKLSDGDIFCVNPHTLHELHGIDCVMVSILFNQTVFEQTLPMPSHPQFFCVSSVDDTSSEAFDVMRSLIAHLIKNNVDKISGFELRNWSYIYSLMDVLYNNFRLKNSDAKEKKNYKYAMRISEISEIIQNNYMDNLTLNDVAEQMHLSVPYLSKFFTEYYGMNFLSCVNQYRLNHAVQELINTDKNIDEIAAESGFSSSHAFVSVFKKNFDMLPRQYRKEQKAKFNDPDVIIEQHDYIAGLKKYLTSETRTKVVSPSREKIISLDPEDGSGYPLLHTWRSVTTVGTASDVLISDIQQMLKKMQTDIGFKYIKLNGVFSDDLHVYSESSDGKAVYNFAYLDKVFDFLLSCNLKPWIQLSYMPQKLAKHPDRFLFNENVSQPKSNEAWCKLVEHFVDHIIYRYGYYEIVKWNYSLWNQPNTDARLYGFDNENDFFDFYQETYRCIKSISKDIQFCLSPTYYIVEDNYQNWYIDFLDKCKANSCLPDSISFTYYDTKLLSRENHSKESFGFIHTMSLSENPDSMKDFVMQVVREQKQLGLNSMPIYLTEWNNSPSQQDLLNDTCFKSCYIVKNILENYDRLQSFAYWSLTDLMKDAPLPDNLFFGGIGLFTKNGIPKASYNAFFLLKKLGNRFLARGDGYFMTKDALSYQIILYNYEHFSHLYANGERFDMTETDRYTVFAERSPIQTHIEISNLKETCYRLTEIFINQENGSVYDAWINAGAIEPVSADDMAYLAALTQPGRHQQILYTNDDGVLTIDVALKLLEVRLLILTPILEI